MLRLTTFGGVLLRQDGTPHVGPASQRRRLALLVLIASAGHAAISRDKLLGYLGPEHDEQSARHALSQSLHALQRALGTDALFVGTDALQLNPTVISSDVQDVEDAIDAQAHERIVALMKGPFLDGFFVKDAPAFEHWAAARRAHYAAILTAALETCAEVAVKRGDHVAAVGWWRRLVAEDPVSARYTLGLMQALVAAADTTSALHFATSYESLVRDQLRARPDEAIAELAARLRARVPETERPAGARAAIAARLTAARSRARDRQRDWLERTLGDRLVIDAGNAQDGAVVAFTGYDRERGVPVDVQLVDPGVTAVADVDVLVAHLERIAALREPRILPLYEFGQAEGIVYYLVGRPAGESLRERLTRDRTLPVPEALAIADDVAAALAHAHAAGVIHADVRPKHVFVAADQVVVAGVGIAEALAAATTREHTSAQLRMGSPAYQSPEQIAGVEKLDARSDVYSLGCILYEMLAGEVPFASTVRSNLASAKLTSAAAPLRGRRDTVTPELDALVQRCLARAAADRFQSAAEFRAALAPLLAPTRRSDPDAG